MALSELSVALPEKLPGKLAFSDLGSRFEAAQSKKLVQVQPQGSAPWGPKDTRLLRFNITSTSGDYLLPEGVRPLDVLGRCDRFVGKPGFSSFCEAMAQGGGMHVVERSGFAEAAALMDGLRRHSQHRCLSRQELDNGAWQLDQPLLAPSEAPLSASGAEEAALALVGWVANHF